MVDGHAYHLTLSKLNNTWMGEGLLVDLPIDSNDFSESMEGVLVS